MPERPTDAELQAIAARLALRSPPVGSLIEAEATIEAMKLLNDMSVDHRTLLCEIHRLETLPAAGSAPTREELANIVNEARHLEQGPTAIDWAVADAILAKWPLASERAEDNQQDAERWRIVRPWFELAENDNGDIQLFVEPDAPFDLNERCAPEGELLPKDQWPTVEELIDELHPPIDAACSSVPAP